MPDTPNAVIIEPDSAHTASIIWLHGLGADGHDFETIVPELRLPGAMGIRFIFPHAPKRPVTINGGMIMRAWYDIKNINLRQTEDADAINASGELLHNFIEAELAQGIASKRIIIAGFSQGGAIALHAALRYSSPLAGVLALSTYLPLPDRLSDEAHAAQKHTPIMMAHGTLDPVIPVNQGKTSANQLEQAGYRIDWHEYMIQHMLCPEEIDDIRRWICDTLG